MARIRSVHPGLFTDEAFAACSYPARLLIIGIWTEADDKGIFEWKPRSLKMRLFPADNVDVAALLDELLQQNIIRQYEAECKTYGAVRNFRKYQRPQRPNDIHPVNDTVLDYVGLKPSIPQHVDDCSANGSGKSIQMEDGGWRRDDGGGNNNLSIQGKTFSLGSTRASLSLGCDDDGVILESDEFEVTS